MFLEAFLFTLYSSYQQHQPSLFLKPPLSKRRTITHSSPGMGGMLDAYHHSDCDGHITESYIIFSYV